MPTITTEVGHASQAGNVMNGTSPYVENNSNAMEVGRSFLVRFSNLTIPRGSTVTASQWVFWISSKNPAATGKLTTIIQMEDTNASGFFRLGVYEDANRTWTTVWTGDIPYAANAGDPQPIVLTDVMNSLLNTKIARADWTEGNPVAFRVYATAEDGDTNLVAKNGEVRTSLTVTYTPPATPTVSTVNLAESADFTVSTYESGAENPNKPYFWTWNSWFGTFAAEPTRTVGPAVDGGSAPYGGNIMKMAAPSATKVGMLYDPINLYGISGPGWYNASVAVFVPNGTPAMKLANYTGTTSTTSTTTGAWEVLHLPVLVSSDERLIQFALESDTAYATGQFCYVANFCITKGREQIYGVSGYRGASGGVTFKHTGGLSWLGGVAEGAKPTTAIVSWNNMSRRGGTNVVFSYSGASAQTQSVIEWRKA